MRDKSDFPTLARRVREGDPMAAATLLAHHHDSIFGIAMRMLRNRQDAEDVTQETMVRALGRIDDYDPGRPFGPWVHRIARNLCIDRFRRKRPTSELNEEIVAAGPTPTANSSFGRAQDVVAHEGQVHGVLHQCFEQLTPPYREVIELYHYKHMSYKQMANSLELPEGTVMNRLFRARKKLGTLMTERGVTP
jgi:RNA polymerase sigma-70 factor (ECF subfamily)